MPIVAIIILLESFKFTLHWLTASLLLQRWDKAMKCKAMSEETLKERFPGLFLGM